MTPTHSAKLVIDESNERDVIHAQSKGEGAYFALVEALANDPYLEVDEEKWQGILAAAGKTHEQFVADAIAAGGN